MNLALLLSYFYATGEEPRPLPWIVGYGLWHEDKIRRPRQMVYTDIFSPGDDSEKGGKHARKAKRAGSAAPQGHQAVAVEQSVRIADIVSRAADRPAPVHPETPGPRKPVIHSDTAAKYIDRLNEYAKERQKRQEEEDEEIHLIAQIVLEL